MIEDKKFFAIRGYIKSGTNWLCRILNLHPEISGVGEFHWHRITTQLLQTYHESQNLSDQPELLNQTWQPLDRFIKEAMVLACDPDAKWVGDRTPSHIEPSVIIGARIFNMVRDGRDIMVSAAYHYFNNPDAWPQYEADESLRRRLNHFQADPDFFRNHPRELLACSEMLNDFAMEWDATIQINRQRIIENHDMVAMEIRYEDLHRDTEGERRRLYEFLDLDPSLATPLAQNTQAGFSKERPDQFLRKGSVGDWQNYFTPQAKEIFNKAACHSLVQYGYVSSPDYVIALDNEGSRDPGFVPGEIGDYEAAEKSTRLKALPKADADQGETLGKKRPLFRLDKMLTSNGYLDAINHEKDSMIIQGWMMLEDGAPDSIAIVSPHGEVYDATSCKRPDLLPHYPNDSSVLNSGYEAVVPRAKFRVKNRYEFSIVARRGNHVAFECAVVKKRADLEGLTEGSHMTNSGKLRIK